MWNSDSTKMRAPETLTSFNAISKTFYWKKQETHYWPGDQRSQYPIQWTILLQILDKIMMSRTPSRTSETPRNNSTTLSNTSTQKKEIRGHHKTTLFQTLVLITTSRVWSPKPHWLRRNMVNGSLPLRRKEQILIQLTTLCQVLVRILKLLRHWRTKSLLESKYGRKDLLAIQMLALLTENSKFKRPRRSNKLTKLMPLEQRLINLPPMLRKPRQKWLLRRFRKIPSRPKFKRKPKKRLLLKTRPEMMRNCRIKFNKPKQKRRKISRQPASRLKPR